LIVEQHEEVTLLVVGKHLDVELPVSLAQVDVVGDARDLVVVADGGSVETRAV
jgi:hypothetical protein